MRYSGTWLTPDDEALLEHLRERGPASPEALFERDAIPFSEAYIEARCARLAGRGGLVSFEGGRYRLTSAGAAYLDAELDPADVPTD